MCRSCIYCEHAQVTQVMIFCEPNVMCTARNNLYVIHPILRALTCRGFKNKHRLQIEKIRNEEVGEHGKGQDQARKDS